MIAKIRLESLSKEYRKKLSERKLTQETIHELAVSISRKYLLQRRLIIIIAVISAVLSCLMALLGISSPSAARGNRTVILFSCAIAFLLELFLLFFLYFAAVTRIPRQFSRCLKKGYPELSNVYGYEILLSGILADASHQAPFSLIVENTIPLQNSRDIVVTGFAHGLIRKNCSVYISGKAGSGEELKTTLVTGIETAPAVSVREASDCPVALRLQNGKDLSLQPGMYLYRKDSLSYQSH